MVVLHSPRWDRVLKDLTTSVIHKVRAHGMLYLLYGTLHDDDEIVIIIHNK